MAKTAISVDDSKTMRDMVAYTLKHAGYEVLQAENGEEAIKLLSQQKVDVVITDLNMPVMDGINLIRALRAMNDYRFTPILMLTTESDSAMKEQGKSAGATGWIVKPFQPEKLVEVVSRVCA